MRKIDRSTNTYCLENDSGRTTEASVNRRKGTIGVSSPESTVVLTAGELRDLHNLTERYFGDDNGDDNSEAETLNRNGVSFSSADHSEGMSQTFDGSYYRHEWSLGDIEMSVESDDRDFVETIVREL